MTKTNERYADGSIKYIANCSKCNEPNSIYGKAKDIDTKLCSICMKLKRQKTIKKHKPSTKHGYHNHKYYERWQNMKARCYNPNNKRYTDWGGRGIIVCDEWKYDAKTYINYISNLEDAGLKDYSVDRINNDKNYEPGNLKWSTDSEQSLNQRNRETNTGVAKIKSETVGNYTRFRVSRSNESFSNINDALIRRKELYGF